VHPAELAERDAVLSLDAAPGMIGREVAGVGCWSVPDLPDVPMVNHAIGLGEDTPVTDDVLDAIAELYAEVGVRYCVCVTPSARPGDIRERLLERGFTHGYDWMKFTRPVDEAFEAATALEVRLVSDSGADEFGRVLMAAYGMPMSVAPTVAAVPGIEGWSCYVAYDDGEPAAAGALFASGDVGWLGLAGTLPAHRRKGGQGAILAARLERAAALGIETLVTETGVMQEGRPSNSYRNIVRSGFTEAYVRENYLSPP
jgi:GNAT superfamily N-acetyltransferase